VKEVTWDTHKVVAVDSAEGHERCTRRFAQNARKNAKSLSNPEMTARYTARNAFQSARTKAAKRKDLKKLGDASIVFLKNIETSPVLFPAVEKEELK
jgi:hypothetical protein